METATKQTAVALKPTQEMFELYDQYCHSVIDRRIFLDRLSKYAVGGVTLAMLTEMLLPKYASALQLAEDDPRISGRRITWDSPNGAGKQGKQMGGYLVKPTKFTGKLPTVVIVHENRGLNPHIADVARRAAASGFLALAPDALYPLGGYPGTDDEGRTLQATRNGAEMLEDFIAAVALMERHPDSKGRVGVTGFCYGGGVCNQLAIRVPTLACSVPFYGAAGAPADAEKVKAPILAMLASTDERINAGYPAWEEALKKAGKPIEVVTWANTQHGFHNDTTPRFEPESARQAWSRTVEFWKQHLA